MKKLDAGMCLDHCNAHMLKAAGVYAILDEDDNVLYIGETISFIRRWGEHCAKGNTKRAPVPIEEIYQFVVLAYEDNEAERRKMEQGYWHLLHPKYGELTRNIFRQVDVKINRYKTRQLRKDGLLEDTYDPYPPIESTDDALEDELKYLNWTEGQDP